MNILSPLSRALTQPNRRSPRLQRVSRNEHAPRQRLQKTRDSGIADGVLVAL